MSERAHLTSLESLEAFRASLIIYTSKARTILDDVQGDLMRTRAWLQDNQRAHWEGQVRRRYKELEQAQQALFGARLASLRQSSDAEQVAVQRHRRLLEEAQEKLRRVKRWCREYDRVVEPTGKQLDHLRNILAIDMPRAVAYLAQASKTLSDYAGIAPSQGSVDQASGGHPSGGEEPGAAPDRTGDGVSERADPDPPPGGGR